MEVDPDQNSRVSMPMATAATISASSANAVAFKSCGTSGTKRSKITNTNPFIEPAANTPQSDLDLWGDCPSSAELAARGLEDRAAAATVESHSLDKNHKGKQSWALYGSSHLSTACAKKEHV